jgi:threonine dehydratase
MLAADRGLYEISGVNNPDVIAGQGTMGLEILEQVPDCDAVIVPVGGGSLIAGLSVAMKSLSPNVRIIGVEPATAASMTAALRAGGPVEIAPAHTIADGLAVAKVGAIAFEAARGNIDEIVTVSEDEIALAILRLIELEKAVVEGAAAASLAAVMCGKLPGLSGRRVVICLSGGNIDPSVLCRVIEHGLVADGRLCRFTVVISDRPGGLAELTGIIAAAGASVKEIHHERAFAAESDVSTVQVQCVLETRNHDHVREIIDILTERRFRLTGYGGPV